MDTLFEKVKSIFGKLTKLDFEKRREIISNFLSMVADDMQNALVDWLQGARVLQTGGQEISIKDKDVIQVPHNQMYKWEWKGKGWRRKTEIVEMFDNVSVDFDVNTMSIRIKIDAPHAEPILRGWKSAGNLFVIDWELAEQYGYNMNEENLAYIDEEGNLRRSRNPSPAWTKVYVGRQKEGTFHEEKNPINDIINRYWDIKWRTKLEEMAREAKNAP